MEIKDLVKECLSEFYETDGKILERNEGEGVSERAVVFRFAHYLQLKIPGYFVDCDFNSSFEGYLKSDGTFVYQDRHGKPIENRDGTVTNRFVDVIVHKRESNPENDLICLEFKKWNNRNKEDFEKDRRNLEVLTSRYDYICGFHVVIHKEKLKSKWVVYQHGEALGPEELVFAN